MKLHNNLDELLSNSSKVKILRFLFTEQDEHTGRGIASAVNMGASSTYRLLQELKEAGIISARRKGGAVLYRLKNENYFVKKLLYPLFEKEKTVYSDIITYIKKGLLIEKDNILSIALFGSVVQRKESTRSDIDLVIVAKNNDGKNRVLRRMDKLSVDMAKKFGIAISPYILTRTEIIKKYTQKQAIIISIMNNNRLLYGEPIERILA